MKDLVPIKPLSARSTQSHRAVSRDQPDERLYTAREVEHELRKYPTRKYKAVCVVILRRSRRAPRVHYVRDDIPMYVEVCEMHIRMKLSSQDFFHVFFCLLFNRVKMVMVRTIGDKDP